LCNCVRLQRQQPTVSPEMWQFLREHHNMVETTSIGISLGMLEAVRVDYAVVSLSRGSVLSREWD
jgi:polar amino acid transport system substrate-binding protein